MALKDCACMRAGRGWASYDQQQRQSKPHTTCINPLRSRCGCAAGAPSSPGTCVWARLLMQVGQFPAAAACSPAPAGGCRAAVPPWTSLPRCLALAASTTTRLPSRRSEARQGGLRLPHQVTSDRCSGAWIGRGVGGWSPPPRRRRAAVKTWSSAPAGSWIAPPPPPPLRSCPPQAATGRAGMLIAQPEPKHAPRQRL